MASCTPQGPEVDHGQTGEQGRGTVAGKRVRGHQLKGMETSNTKHDTVKMHQFISITSRQPTQCTKGICESYTW